MRVVKIHCAIKKFKHIPNVTTHTINQIRPDQLKLKITSINLRMLLLSI